MENALKKSAACQSAVTSQQLALRSSRSTPFFERKPVASYHHHHQHNRAHCHHQHKFSVKRVCWLDGNFSCAVGRSFSLLWFCAVIFHQCWGFDANFHAVLCIQSLLSYEKKFFLREYIWNVSELCICYWLTNRMEMRRTRKESEQQNETTNLLSPCCVFSFHPPDEPIHNCRSSSSSRAAVVVLYKMSSRVG